MGHSLLIALHAAAGVAAFCAGVLALRAPRPGAGQGAARYADPTHRGGLVLMLVGLVGAIALDWAELGPAPRLLFGGFVGLAVAMVAIGFRAARVRPAPGAAPSSTYVGLVGFNLIALFDGFAVVLALDLTGSGWWAAVAGGLGAVVGNRCLAAVKRRRVQPATSQRPG